MVVVARNSKKQKKNKQIRRPGTRVPRGGQIANLVAETQAKFSMASVFVNGLAAWV